MYGQLPPILDLLLFIILIINDYLVPLVFTLAFLAFLWGVFNFFIAGGGEEEKRKEGKKFIVYALIGFFLMFSVWGIINIFLFSFGFNNQIRPPVPTFEGYFSPSGYQNNPFGGQNNGGQNPNTPGGFGNDSTNKSIGSTCNSNSECQSGFCDPNLVGGGIKGVYGLCSDPNQTFGDSKIQTGGECPSGNGADCQSGKCTFEPGYSTGNGSAPGDGAYYCE